jgi:hypothetical protein
VIHTIVNDNPLHRECSRLLAPLRCQRSCRRGTANNSRQDFYHLEYNAVQTGENEPTVWRNTSPLSAGISKVGSQNEADMLSMPPASCRLEENFKSVP